MKLEGSLDAFGLGDVITLLATTGKSGALRLRRNEFTGPAGVVWFRDGLIAGASPDSSRASLLRRIVGAGAVEEVHRLTISGWPRKVRAFPPSSASRSESVSSSLSRTIEPAGRSPRG